MGFYFDLAKRAGIPIIIALALASGCAAPTQLPADKPAAVGSAAGPADPGNEPAANPAATTPAASTADTSQTPTAVAQHLPVAGECIQAIALSGDQSSAVTPVPCDALHYWEVHAQIPISGDVYPGATTLGETAATQCSQSFLKYVGAACAYTRYSSAYLIPDQGGWETPEKRVITCLVGNPDGGLTSSAKGDAKIFPTKGQCTGPQTTSALDLEIVDCAKKHHYEVFAETKIKTKKFPTKAEFDKAYQKTCVTGFKKFVGVEPSKSKYEISYYLATEKLWKKVGDHRLVCAAGLPKGGVKGSLKGVKK